jgi:hypothetical protein
MKEHALDEDKELRRLRTETAKRLGVEANQDENPV